MFATKSAQAIGAAKSAAYSHNTLSFPARLRIGANFSPNVYSRAYLTNNRFLACSPSLAKNGQLMRQVPARGLATDHSKLDETTPLQASDKSDKVERTASGKQSEEVDSTGAKKNPTKKR